MAWYLHLFTRAKYVGSTLRERLPFVPRSSSNVETPAAWDLSAFTKACSDVAGNGHLDARGKALGQQLLVEADHQGFPLDVLDEPIEARSSSIGGSATPAFSTRFSSKWDANGPGPPVCAG